MFVVLAARVAANRATDPKNMGAEKHLFAYSVFYLFAYLFMNLAAFAVIVARERETIFGDDIRGVRGLGAERPALAWPLTISMLALAGLPATAGFIGKLYLIEALVEGDYLWLAIFIVGGTMISIEPHQANTRSSDTPAASCAPRKSSSTDPITVETSS